MKPEQKSPPQRKPHPSPRKCHILRGSNSRKPQRRPQPQTKPQQKPQLQRKSQQSHHHRDILRQLDRLTGQSRWTRHPQVVHRWCAAQFFHAFHAHCQKSRRRGQCFKIDPRYFGSHGWKEAIGVAEDGLSKLSPLLCRHAGKELSKWQTPGFQK